MKIKHNFIKLNIKDFYDDLLLIMIYTIAAICSYQFGYISSIILIIAGVTLYFYYSFKGERSYLKLNAVFSASWLITIGLANLRLLEYQVIWNFYTWILLSVSHIAFINANNIARKYFPVFEKRLSLVRISAKYSECPIEYKINSNSYFLISTVVTVIGIASFMINVYIKGYVPYFVISLNPNAYVEFYTRFHIFVVASMVSGGLSYYTLKKVNLTKLKKTFLVLYIVVIVFVLPILLVQRGTFVNAALILATMVYLLSNRKFIVLFLSIAIIFSIYLFGTSVRGYSDEQLSKFFQPKQINIISKEAETNDNGSQKNNEVGEVHENTSNQPGVIENIDNSEKSTFILPPKMAFLYSYLTVSHDNFNSAVTKNEKYTWGIGQFEPFNVIFRLDWIENKLNEAELNSLNHRVLPHLNTFNLISKAFYDFGIFGVIFFTSIWSFCFGLIEEFSSRYDGVFSKLVYGIIMTPVALSFMNPWLSIFSIWMMWGTIFLMFIASSLNIRKRVNAL